MRGQRANNAALLSNWQRQWLEGHRPRPSPRRVHGGVMVRFLGPSAHSVNEPGFWGLLCETPGDMSDHTQSLQQFKAGSLCKGVASPLLNVPSLSPDLTFYWVTVLCSRLSVLWALIICETWEATEVVRLLFSGQWHCCYISYRKSDGRWRKRQASLGLGALLEWFVRPNSII